MRGFGERSCAPGRSQSSRVVKRAGRKPVPVLEPQFCFMKAVSPWAYVTARLVFHMC